MTLRTSMLENAPVSRGCGVSTVQRARGIKVPSADNRFNPVYDFSDPALQIPVLIQRCPCQWPTQTFDCGAGYHWQLIVQPAAPKLLIGKA